MGRLMISLNDMPGGLLVLVSTGNARMRVESRLSGDTDEAKSESLVSFPYVNRDFWNLMASDSTNEGTEMQHCCFRPP